MFIRTSLIALTAALSLTGGAIAQDAPTADTVVATVNGKAITLGHLILARDALPEQYKSIPDDALFDGLVTQLIQQEVLAQQTDGPDLLTRLRLENEGRTLMAGAAVEAILADAVTEEDIQAAYEEQVLSVEPGIEYNAAHILVETEEEALELISKLNNGADFAELAREFSTGPSGPSGGALGWFSTGMMVAPFEEAVVALEPGQISSPVQTQFGWHVIILNETRTMQAPSLEEVRNDLVNALQAEAMDAALVELTEAAEVTRPEEGEFDPALLRQLDLVLQ